MKLIRQTLLVFQAGASEKVYEVDLCEVGAGRYVVNFRYGRRGAPLKDGSKTVAPVSLAEAEEAFARLVESKQEQGYEVSMGSSLSALSPAPAPASVPASPAPSASGSSPQPVSAPPVVPVGATNREQRILERLTQGDTPRPAAGGFFRNLFRRSGAAKKSGKWPLERAIWRAGELSLSAAVPPLIALFGTSTPLRDHCIVWALGRCGGDAAIRLLERAHASLNLSESVRRMAGEALRRCYPEPQRSTFLQTCAQTLPPTLRELAHKGPAEDLQKALQSLLLPGDVPSKDPRLWAVVDALYLLDTPIVRPALLALARTVSLRPAAFQRLRHLFKASEYRRDAELFGILAWRFETTRALYRRPRQGTWVTLESGQRVRSTAAELASPQTSLAYSSATRLYLRGRVWRTLRRLGRDGHPDYVPMAVGVLLPFTDGDAQHKPEDSLSSYYPWTHLWAFNHILFGKSRRFEPARGPRRWKPPYVRHEGRRGDRPEPAGRESAREESFPELWEQQPAGLLMLLDESRCLPVHTFAVKVFRSRPNLWKLFDDDILLMLLSRPYAVTALLGFEVITRRYDPATLRPPLLLAIAHCVAEAARLEAQQWIQLRRPELLLDSHFLTELLTGAQADTRAFAREQVRQRVLVHTGTQARTGEATRALALAPALAGRLIAKLLTFTSEEEALAGEVVETLTLLLPMVWTQRSGSGAPDESLSEALMVDLLAHPLQPIQMLGGRMLLQHPTLALRPPETLLQPLLRSPFEAVRGIIITLFSSISDVILSHYSTIVFELVTHQTSDLRQKSRPILQRMVNTHRELGQLFVHHMVHLLLEKGSDELHAHLARVLQEDLTHHLDQITPEQVWKLLEARSPAAQELAGRLLIQNVRPETVSLEQICTLGSHEILSVREACWSLYTNSLARLKQDMLAATRLLDAKWQDTRDFAFHFFCTAFEPEDFTPEVLVSICDSVREDVQQLGRSLITRHFAEADGWTYLARLSEHPAPNLQLLATAYLERYAADHPERLESLSLYLVTVLGQVNKGRVAKARVLQFLEQEALKSEASARIIAQVLEQQSGTIARSYHGQVLALMVKLHRAWPQVPLPIRVQTVAERTPSRIRSGPASEVPRGV